MNTHIFYHLNPQRFGPLRKIKASWMVIVLLLFLGAIASAEAGNETGQLHYQAALRAQEKILALIESLDASNEENEKGTATEYLQTSLTEAATAYISSIKSSAHTGFAPAQYMAAHLFINDPTNSPEKKQSNKSEACRLLNESAKHGLLAAAVAQYSYCPQPSAAKSFDQAKRAISITYGLLLHSVSRADPYQAYYPLKAFTHTTCFVPEQNTENLLKLSSIERIKAIAPPMLTFDQFKAEANLLLAMQEFSEDKKLAEVHIRDADRYGCASKLFLRMKALSKHITFE